MCGPVLLCVADFISSARKRDLNRPVWIQADRQDARHMLSVGNASAATVYVSETSVT